MADDDSAAVWTDLENLHPWEGNPRKNEQTVERCANSIKRFGWGAVIIARTENGEMVAGHTRYAAAKLLAEWWAEMTPTVQAAARLPDADDDFRWSDDAVRVATQHQAPVRFGPWTEKEAHLFAVADNKIQEYSEWDNDKLGALLKKYTHADTKVAGYEARELTKLYDSIRRSSGTGLEDPEVPPAPKDPVSRHGDLWLLGDHRLVCGDSRGVDLVRAVDGQAQMVWQDPPYGVEYVGKTADKLTIDNDGAEGLGELLRAAFASALKVTALGAPWYTACPAGPLNIEFQQALTKIGVHKQILVWIKQTLVMGRSHFHYRHEPILYGWTPGASCLHPPPDRKQDTVWEFDRPTRSEEHPTMKPVALVAHAIELSSDMGDVVVDPFMGSGTTIMACEQLGRRGVGTELSPAYTDVIVERWEGLTGGKAKRVKGKGNG